MGSPWIGMHMAGIEQRICRQSEACNTPQNANQDNFSSLFRKSARKSLNRADTRH
jgi:hypothetical protein